jgi:hypothetical protein
MCNYVNYVPYVVNKTLKTYLELIFPVGFDTDPPFDGNDPFGLAVGSEEVTGVPSAITVIIQQNP